MKAWLPVGKTSEYGDVMLIQHTRQSRDQVSALIMEIKEINGSLKERLDYLGWRIAQVEVTESLTCIP